jgi:hypothetical protein
MTVPLNVAVALCAAAEEKAKMQKAKRQPTFRIADFEMLIGNGDKGRR